MEKQKKLKDEKQLLQEASEPQADKESVQMSAEKMPGKKMSEWRSKITKKRLFIGCVVSFILALVILIPTGYFAALKYNLFGFNEGTLEVSIEVEGDNQDEFLDTIKLLVDGKEVGLTDDLTHSQKIVSGDIDLEIIGNYYTNKTAKITVHRNKTTKQTFTLEPTASLSIKAKDFFSDKELSDFATVVAEKKYTSSEGVITVKDILLKNTDIKSFTLSKDGYNDKTIKIDKNIKQGLNEFHDNKLVKEGKFYYVSNSEGSSSIYSANYDGSSKKKLTDDKGSDTSPIYNEKENKVYFMSDRAGEKDDNGNIMYYLYSITPDGKNLKRETTGNYKDKTNIGNYSVYSKLRTYSKWDQGQYRYFLYYGSIKGDAITRIDTEFNDYYSDMAVSHNGNFVVYSQRHNYGGDNTIEKVYHYNIATKKHTVIFEVYKNESLSIQDVSPDSKYLLISVDDNKGGNNLWRVGIGDKKKLTDDKNSKYSARFLPGGQKISYFMTVDSTNGVYTRNIDGTSEQKWTGSHKVRNYVWVNATTLLFSTEDAVFITKDAGEAKEVLSGVSSGTFSTFSGYDY